MIDTGVWVRGAAWPGGLAWLGSPWTVPALFPVSPWKDALPSGQPSHPPDGAPLSSYTSCLHSHFSSANPSCALVPCQGLPLTSHLSGCSLSPPPSTVHLIKNYSSWISQGPAGSRHTLEEGDHLGRCEEEWGKVQAPHPGCHPGAGLRPGPQGQEEGTVPVQGCMGWTLQGGINGSTSRATAPHPWVKHRASREGVERGRSPKVGVKQRGRPQAHSSRAAIAPASAGREAVLIYMPWSSPSPPPGWALWTDHSTATEYRWGR